MFCKILKEKSCSKLKGLFKSVAKIHPDLRKVLLKKKGFFNCRSTNTKFLKEVLLSILMSNVLHQLNSKLFSKMFEKSVALKRKGLKKVLIQTPNFNPPTCLKKIVALNMFEQYNGALNETHN